MHECESTPAFETLARGLSLDSLRLLSLVVREGSMAAAARAEPLTASAISKRIAELERLFGRALLQRVGDRLQPTPDGRVVLAQWHLIERELEMLVHGVARLAAPATPTAAPTWAERPQAISRTGEHPGSW